MEKAQRLISLDVLRGITIAGMIIVNNPGSWKHVYTPLTHAVWNGLTPTDLVFPFFMFIMGISTYISLKKFNFSFSLPLIKKVVKRTILLFLIGLFINWCAKGMCSFQELRIPGVLQRLALLLLFYSYHMYKYSRKIYSCFNHCITPHISNYISDWQWICLWTTKYNRCY